MKQDIRDTDTYREALSLFTALRRPGTGQLADAEEINVSRDGKRAVFTGTFLEAIDAKAATRICSADLESGELRVLTFGPQTDRLPRHSPSSQQIAFLSDRHRPGDFQLYLLDAISGAASSTPRVQGWVEYLHWSPDGSRILLGVAGHGADVSGGSGAVTSQPLKEDLPSWMPRVETGDETYRWRRLWVYEVADRSVRPVGPSNINVWEACWCGDGSIAAVTSPAPGEACWYTARLHLIEVAEGTSREVFVPRDQIAWPAASPSGRHLAFVESICSDRGLVAGELRLLETPKGVTRPIDANGVDIAYTQWQSDTHLLVAGHRGFETVVGIYDLGSSVFTEMWASCEVTTGGRYITVAALREPGDCVLIGESFARPPELGLIRKGEYRTVRPLLAGSESLEGYIAAVQQHRWRAPDGLPIQGWLLRPAGAGPHPMILHVHGGPVWQWRNVWLGRRGIPFLMLLKRGYAIFLPNPRGSTGHGQDFARRVVCDMGGADTQDFLSGIDHVVAAGIADPDRLGVTGTSYGGFMSCWLITHDARFRAAVPVSPITNLVTEHLISNISGWVSLFTGDTYRNVSGQYYQRSPILQAHKARVPTLNICGALDRCTPPGEAMQFHNALLENGVRSVLVTYPQEGHGVRKLPALIDYAARMVEWFDEHLS